MSSTSTCYISMHIALSIFCPVGSTIRLLSLSFPRSDKKPRSILCSNHYLFRILNWFFDYHNIYDMFHLLSCGLCHGAFLCLFYLLLQYFGNCLVRYLVTAQFGIFALFSALAANIFIAVPPAMQFVHWDSFLFCSFPRYKGSSSNEEGQPYFLYISHACYLR